MRFDPKFLLNFEWESKAQKQGFLGFLKWWRDRPVKGRDDSPDHILCAVVAYFIQREHESHLWWSETVGDLVSRLEDQIGKLQARILELERGNR